MGSFFQLRSLLRSLKEGSVNSGACAFPTLSCTLIQSLMFFLSAVRILAHRIGRDWLGMDHIADYSTDSSDDSEPENQLPPPDFVPFLENYLAHNNMASVFLHIPWNPPVTVANRLRAISYRALEHLKLLNPAYMSCYTWNAIGERTKLIHGKFSILNKGLLRSHHITLCPNIIGKPHDIDEFVLSFDESVRKMHVPQPLIQQDVTEAERAKALEAVLFGNRRQEQKNSPNYIGFRFEPQLRIFRSSSSSSVFLAAVIDFSEPETAAWYDELWTIIQSNVDQHGLKLDTRRSEKSLSKPTLHVSLLYGELYKRAPNQWKDVCASLQNFLDDSLKNTQVCVDHVVVSRLPKTRSNIQVPFPLR